MSDRVTHRAFVRALAASTMLALAPFALLACERSIPPAMSIASPSAAEPAPGPSTVVFVRPGSPCDGSDYWVVVDAQGRFVGHLAPGTKVAASVEPGSHVYYAWSSVDLRTVVGTPDFNPVAAVRVGSDPGHTGYVALIVLQRNSTVTRCEPYALVNMMAVTAGDRDLGEWLAESKLLVADRSRGQALLDSNPAKLRNELALGRAKLDVVDAFQAGERDLAAERAAGSR
jgi:hypothetical protein